MNDRKVEKVDSTRRVADELAQTGVSPGDRCLGQGTDSGQGTTWVFSPRFTHRLEMPASSIGYLAPTFQLPPFCSRIDGYLRHNRRINSFRSSRSLSIQSRSGPRRIMPKYAPNQAHEHEPRTAQEGGEEHQGNRRQDGREGKGPATSSS